MLDQLLPIWTRLAQFGGIVLHVEHSAYNDGYTVWFLSNGYFMPVFFSEDGYCQESEGFTASGWDIPEDHWRMHEEGRARVLAHIEQLEREEEEE